MRWKRKSYFSLEQSLTSSILSKLWKIWFSLSLHVNFNYNDLWNGCKLFVLQPSWPTKARFNYWFNFHSLNYKQKASIVHLPLSSNLHPLCPFFDIINGTFFESCFCLSRGKYKKHIELDLEVVTSKIGDIIWQILFSWWILFKSFNNSTLNFVSFVLIKRFRFQPQWKIILSQFYKFFCFFLVGISYTEKWYKRQLLLVYFIILHMYFQ